MFHFPRLSFNMLQVELGLLVEVIPQSRLASQHPELARASLIWFEGALGTAPEPPNPHLSPVFFPIFQHLNFGSRRLRWHREFPFKWEIYQTTTLGQGHRGWGAETWKEGRQRNRKGAQGPLQLHIWSILHPFIWRCLEEDRRKYVVSPPPFSKEGLPFLLLAKCLMVISIPCMNTLQRPARS